MLMNITVTLAPALRKCRRASPFCSASLTTSSSLLDNGNSLFAMLGQDGHSDTSVYLQEIEVKLGVVSSGKVSAL